MGGTGEETRGKEGGSKEKSESRSKEGGQQVEVVMVGERRVKTGHKCKDRRKDND